VAPAAAAALLLTGLEIYRVIRPDAPVFGDPPPATLAEGIARRFPIEQTYRFLRAGQDPNMPVTFTDPDYTGGQTVSVSPLMLAAAARDSSAVQMLLNFGVRTDLQQNRLALCLARALGDDAIVELIEGAGDGAESEPECPEPKQGASTPLLAWVE
jgi:hypothetical protein